MFARQMEGKYIEPCQCLILDALSALCCGVDAFSVCSAVIVTLAVVQNVWLSTFKGNNI